MSIILTSEELERRRQAFAVYYNQKREEIQARIDDYAIKEVIPTNYDKELTILCDIGVPIKSEWNAEKKKFELSILPDFSEETNRFAYLVVVNGQEYTDKFGEKQRSHDKVGYILLTEYQMDKIQRTEEYDLIVKKSPKGKTVFDYTQRKFPNSTAKISEVLPLSYKDMYKGNMIDLYNILQNAVWKRIEKDLDTNN